MLLELEIKDFALFEHVRVPFSPGLNVLTGETGAGKSIILDALNAVLGGRTGTQVLRPQAERAIIEATFNCSPELSAILKKEELLEEAEEQFCISRELSRAGSKIRINGILTNISFVQNLRQRLLTVHAQHESRTLLSPQYQLEMLDALGDKEHRQMLGSLKTLYAKRKQLLLELEEILSNESEREKQIDYARFQLNELEDAELEDPLEDESIAQRRDLLSRVSDIEALLLNVQVYLKGQDSQNEPGALELIQKAVSDLAKAASFDSKLKAFEETLNESFSIIEDLSRELRKYYQSLDTDPETLANLSERAALLAGIKRKYGPDLAQAIQKRDRLIDDLERLGKQASIATELESELDEINQKLYKIACDLSQKRQKLAGSLAHKIQAELSELGMLNCRFEISLSQTGKTDSQETAKAAVLETIGPNGFDRAEFLISANPGQPPAPVAKIASGGELSRVMLAVKTIFAGADRVNTVIFDEIDTGLSGRVLQSMRDKLAYLAKNQQILCVTHQPIIASVADNHIYVLKEQSKKSTRSEIKILDEQGRLKALASMASGQEEQEAALSFARSLLDESLRIRAGQAGSL